MKKIKRENLLSPSSSWRENPLPHRKNSNSASVSDFGCLPGFFHLLFRNPRKSLTFGSKKREHRTVVCASPAETTGSESRSDPPPLTPPECHARPHGEGEAARTSLVGALEKCDRDLEELRRTINVIKTTFFLHQKLPVPPPTAAARDNLKSSDTGDVSRQNETTAQEPDTSKGKPININLIKTGLDVGSIKNNIVPKRSSTTCGPVVRKARRSMVESVNQVCDDVAWGQRREVGRIGLALQDHICRDLIDETVRALSFPFSDHFSSPASLCYSGGGLHRRRGTASLPLDACRKRLVF